MPSQLIQPTATAPPVMLCSPTQMQLVYQFMLNVQPKVDSSCMRNLQDLLTFRTDESSQHQLENCQQEVQNLTSMHFNQLTYLYKNWARIDTDRALEISKYIDRIKSLSKDLEYMMEQQELNRNKEKGCPKKAEKTEGNVAVKQVYFEVFCDKGANLESLDGALLHATFVRNPSLVNSYLECGADPNSTLHLAVYYGLSDIVQLLLDRGADVDLQRKNDKWTPLHGAVQQGHLDVVRLLLSKGADTGVRRSDECTPLYQASSLGNVEIVQVLLEYNASLELTCENDYTPLHVAAKNNHVNVASVLLGQGADVNGGDSNKDTGLHLAARLVNLEIVNLMIQHNATVDLPNKDGWTPLHVASQNNHIQIAQALLDAGADVNKAGGQDSQTPLYTAAVSNSPETVNLLIQHNADVDLPNKDGWTPLHAASKLNDTDIAQALLDAGADVNKAGGPDSQTPLHAAAVSNSPEIVKLLIQYNADVDLPNKDGWTALHNASQNNYLDTAKVTLEAGADVNVLGGPYLISPLFLATWKGNEEMVKLLMQHNANVSLPNKLGWTALHVVCQFININIAKILIDAGTDVNIKNPISGFAPLHIASKNGALEMAQLLVNNGANPKQPSNDNITPRNVASISGHKQVAEYLASVGG